MSRISAALLSAGGDVPLFAALIAQGAGAMAAFGTSFAVEYALGAPPPLLLVLAGQGAAAAVVGARLGLAPWWIPINLALPPSAGLVLMLGLPGWVYLALFAALLLFYWNAGRGRIPLYLSSRRAKEELARLLPVRPDRGASFNARGVKPARGQVRFLDLGSGFGGTVLALAAKREGEFVGIESAPLPFALSWLRVTFSGLPQARVVHGDFWKHDLAGYDVVYAFLSPAPMAELFSKARREMSPGSLFIANTFDVPGETPERTVALEDWRQGRLLIWRM
ncbi:MAG: class I SAM-dependent methyltransferase [Rhodospirillales bacterium]|nr:class I SAM-dependent methyltransferase [Rhodospirillales bacterium]